MGNAPSTSNVKTAEKGFDNFYDIVDHIATYYILTMDFKSLSKLSEKEYCDNLVVITADIIKRYFNDMDITYLAQRVKNGQEVNDLTKESVTFVNKEQLESLDISNDAKKSLKKKRVCIGIAKFYVKIAHIFAAIVMTINPVYAYKDSTGQTVKTGLMEKDKIPKGVNRKLLKLNICDNRIRALKKGETFPPPANVAPSNNIVPPPPPNIVPPPSLAPSNNIVPPPSLAPSNNVVPPANVAPLPPPNNANVLSGGAGEDETFTMQPKICDMNIGENGTAKSLTDEPGIPELMALYLDDNYDYSNGTFTGMSSETKSQFQNDLKTFYTAFTGNDVMPPEITRFSDIKLRDFNSLKGCQGANSSLKNKYTINKNDKLFAEYAKNTQNMILTASTNQSKLLDVINELFTYVIDPYSGKQKIRVNPKLTDESLQKCVEKTRKLIIDLYVNCEMDYVKGIKLYEAIVEAKILETTQKQIQSLTKQASKIIEETTKVSEPVTPSSIAAPPINPSANIVAAPIVTPSPINPPPIVAAPIVAAPIVAAPIVAAPIVSPSPIVAPPPNITNNAVNNNVGLVQ